MCVLILRVVIALLCHKGLFFIFIFILYIFLIILLTRYVLKKRFGRGSYGEVWLAFNWNCNYETNGSSWTQENINSSYSNYFGMYNGSSCRNTSTDDSYSRKGNLFILKRIMVSDLFVWNKIFTVALGIC